MPDLDLPQLFRQCWETALRSPDRSTQIGVVVVTLDGSLFDGANEYPRGLKVCERHHERPTKYAYIEHAERNAVYGAARSFMNTHGATMVGLWAACADCARAIVQSGIVELVRHQWFLERSPASWMASIEQGDEILRDAGVTITNYDGPIDTQGRALRFCGEEILPWGSGGKGAA